MSEGEQMTTWIYHITHISNLASMIQQGRLCCDRLVLEQNLSPTAIGYQDLKQKRLRWTVPKEPGGMLGDYVPFYFVPRSPMLYAISKGRVPRYNGGQRSVLHLVASAEQVAMRGLPFVFTDGHAYMRLTSFFDNLAELDQVDWQMMQEQYWNDTPEDGDRARRRQAEFLVHHICPWMLVRGIGVYDADMAQQAQHLLEGVEHQPQIVTRPAGIISAQEHSV